jgi:hypothetical protein
LIANRVPGGIQDRVRDSFGVTHAALRWFFAYGDPIGVGTDAVSGRLGGFIIRCPSNTFAARRERVRESSDRVRR